MRGIPPHNLEAERAVLGAALLEAGSMARIVGVLQATDFYTEAHRVIFEAAAGLFGRDEPVDLITVSHALTQANHLELAGGPAALAVLAEQAAIDANLMAYVMIVRDLAILRSLIQAGVAAATAAYEAHQHPAIVLGDLESRVEALRRRSVAATEYDPSEPWRRMVASWGRGVIQSGFPALDTMTGGIARGEIVVIGGRSSHGKTAISFNRALAWAKAGLRVDVLALEESEEAATRRLVANEAGVPLLKLRTGQMDPLEFRACQDAVEAIQALPLRVIGSRALQATDDRTVRGAISVSRADIVILDHIGKVQCRLRGKGDLQTYAVARLLDQLHELAIRDDKVVVVNAQLKRDAESRFAKFRNAVPLLGDLADSDAIGRVARQVWLLLWPWKAGMRRPKRTLAEKIDQEAAPAEYDPSTYWLYVAKMSEAGTGRVDLRYDASVGRFAGVEESA